jgi:hypothetical protein
VEIPGLKLGNVHIGGFEGWVDDVKIYERAINADEVASLSYKYYYFFFIMCYIFFFSFFLFFFSFLYTGNIYLYFNFFSVRYLGRNSDFEGEVSKLSECLSSNRDVVCYVITNNFEGDSETEPITLTENYICSIRSLINCLDITLSVEVVNVLGCCNFTSLTVCSVNSLFLIIFCVNSLFLIIFCVNSLFLIIFL